MIDNGADIIFGQGPHVTRSIEVYKDRFISYSLGISAHMAGLILPDLTELLLL